MPLDGVKVDGHYRKFLGGLTERLGGARRNVLRAFDEIGIELIAEPRDGTFAWRRFPHIEDSLALAQDAQREGIVLAPGAVFRPHLERSPWMRFNLAICDDPGSERWLKKVAGGGRIRAGSQGASPDPR